MGRQRFRTRGAGLVAMVALTGVSLAMLAPAAGGQAPAAIAELVGITENAWVVSYVGNVCGDDDVIVTGVAVQPGPEDDPIEVTPLSQSPAGPNAVNVLLPPDAPEGLAIFEIECDGPAPNTTVADTLYAWVAIEKVVTGPVPETATFTVNVACGDRAPAEVVGTSWGDVDAQQSPEPFSVDLPYGATGGVAYVYTDGDRECEITEPNNGGATSTTIDVPEDLYADPTDYAATVTNLFVPVVEPTFTG